MVARGDGTTTLEPKRTQSAGLIRGHWAGVENHNPWQRNARMGADRSRSRNRSLLTHLALIRDGLLRILKCCLPGDSLPDIRECIQAKPSFAFRALKA
jgi:hypothetical protein